ncbi:MAG TPA: flagellinolysin [Burkholderiales bacterium]|nr:flagellinolysin [Burkholderiales bacterium]
MSLSIKTNVSALSAQRHAYASEPGVQKAIQRLSSGLRINRAADDAAGLAISERMTSSIRGADQSKRNINDAVSFLQVADGVMNNVVDKLQRLRELAVQAGSATVGAADKAALQQEASQLLEAITTEVSQTQFNGSALFSDNTVSIGGEENRRAMIDRLKLGWLNEAERLIQTYYGIQGDGAPLTIGVDNFTDGGSGVLARVEGLMGANGSWYNLHMSFDMADFSPPNDSSDRIVAHELAHAVMARTMNFSALPNWFREGTAELIHGADERLAGVIAGSSVAAVVASVGGGFSYEGSYAASRYLHHQLKEMGVAGGIKGIMQYLDGDQTADLDDALNAVTGGTYATAAAFVADFTANGATYITNEMNLTNADTGAIGGLDADGGAERSSANVFSDVNTYPDVLDGFAERFPTLGGTTGAKSYVLQIGENVGDTMTVALSALNASALGLAGFNLQGRAALNMMHVDEALAFVNKERANVGASMARLDSISATLSAQSENLAASRSRIRDADYASETVELTRTMILQKSATTMIAQANATPQMVLTLLR